MKAPWLPKPCYPPAVLLDEGPCAGQTRLLQCVLRPVLPFPPRMQWTAARESNRAHTSSHDVPRCQRCTGHHRGGVIHPGCAPVPVPHKRQCASSSHGVATRPLTHPETSYPRGSGRSEKFPRPHSTGKEVFKLQSPICLPRDPASLTRPTEPPWKPKAPLCKAPT